MSLRGAATVLPAALILLALTSGYIEAEEAEYASLKFTVYLDGVVSVNIQLTVNETYPTVEVALPATPLSDPLVLTGKGELLAYELAGCNLTVDTLGETNISIEYETLDLTYKNGLIWGFEVDAPVEFTVILPWNSTIVDLSTIPTEITTLPDGRISVSMPRGRQYVEYMSAGLDPASEALDAIAEALKAIEKAEKEGRTQGLEEARNLLEQAVNLLSQKDYVESKNKALESLEKAEKAVKPEKPVEPWIQSSLWIYLLPALAVLTILLSILYAKRRRSLEAIIQENPWLNEDEKNLLKTLWDKGGSAFESELREKLKLPRSTVWRMVKRLEREGMVTVEKVRGENRVRIRR